MYSLRYLVFIIIFRSHGFSQNDSLICGVGIDKSDANIIKLRYRLSGHKWNCRFLTYYIGGTADVAGTAENNAIEDAMDSWSAVTNIDFLEACNAGDADIRISWETGSHSGDNLAFDGNNCGPGGEILAHAFLPSGAAIDGDVHFDDDEEWGVSGAWACDNIDVESVALHELGHSLGLRHSNSSGAVMNNVLNEIKRNLTTDDINGIRAIYGSDANPIGGNGSICKNGSQTFGICLTDNIDVTWSVTSNLQVTGGQGTDLVTVKATGTGTGEVTAIISTGCDNIQFSRDVEIINSVPDYTKLDAKDENGTRILVACQITEGEATYTGTGPIIKYEWDIPFASNWFIDPITSWTPYETVEIDYFEDPAPSTEDFLLRAKNVCGWSAWKGTTWTVTDNCSAKTASNDSIRVKEPPVKDMQTEEILSLKLYPTVTNQVINVRWDRTYKSSLKFDIYNSQGSLVKSLENVESNNSQIFVDDLPAGLYFCNIKGKDFHQTEKFIIIE